MKNKNFKWWIALPVAITTLPLIAAACGNTSGKEMDKKPSPNIPDMNSETKPNPDNSGNGGNNNMTPPKPDDKNNQGDKGDNNNTSPKPNDESEQSEKERQERERLERERFEKERLEKEKRDKERQEKEEKEKLEREKQEQDKRERQRKEREIRYLSLYDILYLRVIGITTSIQSLKSYENIKESMSIIEQIRSEFSAMDFVELYREVYLKKIPEASPFVKKIVENVLNGVLKPIDLGKEFINKFKEYINSNEKNTEFEDIITKLLLDNPVDGRYYPFIFLLEYTSSSFTNFSNPSENSEYYISLFKKYWDQLISLKNSDFLNYQYLYYLKKSLSNYNNDKANKFYNNRQNVEISLAIEKIIDKAISNKSLLSEMDVQEINTLFKKAEGLIKY
ncbi:hypothetical protein [[Mycoplasma] phocae]|nr:hypothetical protein [[Mycoplasma] phocae]